MYRNSQWNSISQCAINVCINNKSIYTRQNSIVWRSLCWYFLTDTYVCLTFEIAGSKWLSFSQTVCTVWGSNKFLFFLMCLYSNTTTRICCCCLKPYMYINDLKLRINLVCVLCFNGDYRLEMLGDVFFF